MGGYPVTNAQFALFIAAGGYEEQGKRWWSDEGWKWRKKGQRRWSERSTDQPEYWDNPRFGKARPGYPVVGVSWYEASAYAAWLTELLRRHRAGGELERVYRDLIAGLPEHVAVVRLPTDEEWVAAAGGAQGDRYPWGQDWDESRANATESGTGGTTPVAVYPSGQSPRGIWDMGGNVWEWMHSGEKVKSLRGGSWFSDQRIARVGGHLGNVPGGSDSNFGFRLVGSRAPG